MKTIGILIAAAGMSCMAAHAQDHRQGPAGGEETAHFAWADVLRVNPLYDDQPAAGVETSPPTTREECVDDTPPAQQHADNRGVGTVIGAIVGGLVGNRFGKGDGRKATTAAGVLAGAVIGNNAGKNADLTAPDAPPPMRCRTVEVPGKTQRRIVAYDVEYRYRGEIYMARVPYDPGDRMRVRVSVVPAD